MSRPACATRDRIEAIETPSIGDVVENTLTGETLEVTSLTATLIVLEGVQSGRVQEVDKRMWANAPFVEDADPR